MKLHCPSHEDSTPSLHVYTDGAYCFVCNFRCDLGALDLSDEEFRKLKREPEDIEQTIRYIQSLPFKDIRGLKFRSDSNGYFVVWPDLSHYRKRLYYPGKARYLGPRGIPTPLFKYSGDKTLILVEGEINAMSLKHSLPECTYTIASPGSATELPRHLNEYLTYDRIWIIVDKDAPGVANGLHLKYKLLNRGKKVELVALSKDLNDVLVQSGVNGVKETIKKETSLEL